jgi:predicted secreted hydrolase
MMALPGALALPRSTWAQTNADDDEVRPDRALRFPRDHGAHPGSRIEWWYITGWLTSGKTGGDGLMGFQLTFFRSRTGLGAGLVGHLVPRQLLFAHAAISELKPGGHRHAQRVARWSEDERDAGPIASRSDTQLRLGAWRLQHHNVAEGSRFDARLAAPEAGFTLDLALTSTQPLLLQGTQGFSLKGPPVAPGQPAHASLYYSMPQLAVQGAVTLGGRDQVVQGRAWLDHEWSNALMPPGAVGWDWIGINLTDGGALTAFVLRAADGRALWAGGSHRSNAGVLRTFAANEVLFAPLRHWNSPETGARYPVRWRVTTPAGAHEVEALLDAQELDSRRSTGSAYWEGLSALRDAGSGQRIGLGYLEMTGYAGALRLG